MKIINIIILFFFVSAVPIEKKFEIEIDNEEIQRYKGQHGVWKNNIFEKKDEISQINKIIFEEEKLLFPLKNKKINDRFGKTKSRYHLGVDYEAKHGELLVSIANGKVTEKGYRPNIGYYLVIKTENQISFLYAHLSKIYVEVEDEVDIGQAVGRVGISGNSTGPHLHLEINYQNVYFDHKHFFYD